jgi:peroxiredoxin
LILLAAIAIAVVLTLVACTPPDAVSSPGYVSGDGTVTEWAEGSRPGPLDLTGTGFDGSSIDLSDYEGDVVFVTTWYAACPPCRAEAPDLIALDALDGVTVIGVNTKDDPATAQAFERTFGVTYPSIGDSDGKAVASLQGLVAINAVPTGLVIDPQGFVAARTVGRVELTTLQSLIAAAAGNPDK